MRADDATVGALTDAERRRGLIAVVASMAVISLIYGLSVPLLALVLEHRGVGSTLIGLNTAVQPMATLAVAPVAPRIIAALGPAHTMLAAALGSAVIFLLLPAFPGLAVWFGLRFLLGAFGCFLWIVGEAWVNQMATEDNRGRLVSIYAATASGGVALGPLVLSATGSEGWTPFFVAASLVSAAGTPLLFAARLAPRLDGQASAGLPVFLALAPVAMLLNLVHGASIEILLPFFPIYGLHLGMSEAAPLHLLTVALVGGIVLQVPFGWLADRMDRRLLAVASALLLLAGIAAMPFLVPRSPWNLPFMFAFGGVFSALYCLAIVLLGERFRGMDLIYAATVFNVMWSLGSTAGPALGGIAMRLWDPHGIIVVLALLWLLYLPVPVASYMRRRGGKASAEESAWSRN